MKIDINNVAHALVQHGIPAEQQGQVLKAAVARVLGYLLPIPAAPVDNLAVHFKGTLEGRVAPVLDALNERFPFEYQEALDCIFSVWEARYRMVHPMGDREAWTMLDTCIEKGKFCQDLDFSHAGVQLVSKALCGAMA